MCDLGLLHLKSSQRRWEKWKSRKVRRRKCACCKCV